MGMTKTQAATLAKLIELTANGPLDVTYGGIKGVNRTALWALESAGVIVIERRGWLQKELDTSRYSVTYHVLQLAHRGTPAKSLSVAAAPIMEKLSTHIDQSCHLVVLSGTRGLVAIKVMKPRV